jgi:alginate O-acetyltransferase complex protein AlgI
LERRTSLGGATARLFTFGAVTVGWVFFRAASFDDALAILRGMGGLNGVSLPAAAALHLGPLTSLLEHWGVTFELGGGARFLRQYAWIAALLPLVWFAPNTQEIMGHFRPALDFRGQAPLRLAWRPTLKWSAAVAALAVGGLLSLSRPSEFLYYQF